MYLFSFLVSTVLFYTAQSQDFTLLDPTQVVQVTRSVVLIIGSDKEIKVKLKIPKTSLQR